HQAGFEIIGNDDDPVYDAQIILAMHRYLERLKIKDISLRINSIGCRICRPNYRKKLVEYYKGVISESCGDCKRRFKQNPLRLLDCKNEKCQELKSGAPILLDSICSICAKHFKGVLEFLDELKIPYQLDNYLVRGLDYYNRTAFEFFTDMVVENEKDPSLPGLKFDFALGGGGRYDYLFEMFGNRQLAGVGGAFGLDRLVEVMKAAKVNLGLRPKPNVFFIYIGEYAKKRSLTLIESLRDEGIPMMESLGKDSLGAQLRSANKEQSDYALIFGQKEAFEESIIIRDLRDGVQETVPLKKLVAEIKKRLK
ncbi:MAG: ATP phosphoribosyltransferase regulatory subunit, partial [Patescibacteria group bacterium]